MTERLHFDFFLSCIGEGNGNPLQCSCLENPRDGGAWWAAVYGVTQSRTQLKQLSSSKVPDTLSHLHFLPTYSLSCIYSGLRCHSSFKTHSNHLKVLEVPTCYVQENFPLNICRTYSFTSFFTKCLFKMSFLTTLFIISITPLHPVHLFIQALNP